MRKYRSNPFAFGFGNRGSLVDVFRSTNFLYIFVAWNVFAYCAYRWYEKKKVKDKEKWKKMSSGKYSPPRYCTRDAICLPPWTELHAH